MNLGGLFYTHLLQIAIYQVACAFGAAFVARAKRRDEGHWFIFGLIFGVLGVAALLIVKRLPDELAPHNNLLLDSEHYLRSGWRAILFVIGVIALYYVSAILAKLTGIVPPQSFFFLFYIDVAIATFLLLHFVDRRKFSSVGFPYHGKIWREFLLGFAIGAVMIGIVGGVELVSGSIRLDLRYGLTPLLLARNLGLSLIFFGYFALGEELVFRGYPYQALLEGIGPVGATALMSVFFGAAHLANPDASVISTLNTMLAGVWLSVAYLKTKTLYFPFGMHFSWNLVQSFFLSLPVSGLLTNRTIFVPTDYGPDWLTGGRYGPEAGIATTAILVVVILYFILEKRISPAYDFLASKARRAAAAPDPAV